jgi:DNA-directed RNA polymerase specialized sigma subunit
MQVISLTTQSEQTNQLAADVRDGNADILTLWAAVERFASQQAGRWTRAFHESAGIEESDLMQTAFLALIEALTAWKPERGVFLTMFDFKLKSSFTAACGMRTRRDKEDPLFNRNRVSLDMPLDADGDGDFTVADTIPDPAAEAGFEEVEERELKNAVYAALDQLPQHERDAIVAEFWHEQAVDHRTHAAALRHLRHPGISRGLRPFYE